MQPFLSLIEPVSSNLASKAGVGYTYGDTTHDHAVTLVDDDSNVSSKTITIRAKKFNANGVTTHPLMQLYIDGQQVASWLVTGRSSYANYTTTQTISNNEEIAVLCSNCSQYIWLDIDYVTVGSQTVQAEGPATLLDLGVDEEAFDWLNVSKPAFAVLVEPGAMRFVVGNNAFAGKYDANGNISETWTDAFGRLLKSQGATGPAVTYTYDAADRLTSALYGSALTSITYDIAGRKLSMSDPDMGNWTYQYDALGNLTRQTDARGQRICLYYDGLNRLTGKHYRSDDTCPSNPTLNVSYGYDAAGHRTSMTDAGGSTTWTYTLRGLPETETKTITGAGTFATKYTYNSADLPTNMQYPADNAGSLTALPSLTYTYHPQLTLDTLGSYVTGTTYDAAGRITNRNLGNGTAIANTYNPWTLQGGRLANILAVQSGITRQSLGYTYDVMGNITQIADGLGLTTNYTNDALNRLDTTSESSKNNPEYDALTGNLANLNGTNPATQYGYNDPEHLHAVTHIGGILKYMYDANGNMTQRPNQTLQYNPENQLTAVTGTPSATFVYDGDGNRVLTTINGVTTAYVGGHTEWNVTAQEMTRYFMAGSQRVAFRIIKSGQPDRVYYLLGDHLGSSSVVMQVGGGVESQTYTAWGELRTGGITTTHRQYTGQINEAALGLYFYNARYYDSALGRFISADTIVPKPGSPQDWDRYSYVQNSPLNYTDPSGHMQACVDGDLGGGCGSDGTGLYILNKYLEQKADGTTTFWGGLTKAEQNALTNNDWNSSIWEDAIGGPGVIKADVLHDPAVWITGLVSAGKVGYSGINILKPLLGPIATVKFSDGFTAREKWAVIRALFKAGGINNLNFSRGGLSPWEYAASGGTGENGSKWVTLYDTFFSLSIDQQVYIMKEEIIHTLQNITVAAPGVAQNAEAMVDKILGIFGGK